MLEGWTPQSTASKPHHNPPMRYCVQKILSPSELEVARVQIFLQRKAVNKSNGGEKLEEAYMLD